jgi:hypothetical protein
MSSATTAAARFGEHARLRDRSARNVAYRVHVRERCGEIRAFDGNPAVDGEARSLDGFGDTVDGNADEEVVRDASAAGEACVRASLVTRRVSGSIDITRSRRNSTPSFEISL